AEARDRRYVERKNDGFRNFAELRLQARHHSLDVERLGMALLPRFQADENRAEIRLICTRHDAVAADRRKRIDAFGLREDLFDLGQTSARPLERRGGRERHVDTEDALVLVGDDPRRQRAAEKPGTYGDSDDD